MAANPIVVPITPPRVAFLTPNGFISREWYRFLLSLATQAAAGTEVVNLLQFAPDPAASLAATDAELASVRQTLDQLPLPTQDPLVLDTRQALDQLPLAATVDQLAVLQASIDALAASPASGAYSVASGVTSIANGGTGVSSTPANGQIDIGNGLDFTRTTLTAGTGASISNTAGSITISATGTGGTVTSVAALTLGTTGTDLSSTVANGTTTPVITLQVPTASAANRGALSAADWTTFNNKGSGSVTSVAQSFTGGLISVAGSPITTSGTLALTVAGTSGGVPYFASGTTWATSAALAANAIVLGGGAGAAPATTITGTGVVTALGVNTGTAGAFVVNGGALGTPASGVVTNLTGTASININGTVGATTATTGAFTTLSSTGVTTLQSLTVGLGASAVATNTALGVTALAANTTGAYNVATGYQALYANTTASYNTAFGYAALKANTTAVANTAVGFFALTANTTGAENTAVGFNALNANTTGNYNAALGTSALGANTTASYNTAFGYSALATNATGASNTAVGFQSMTGCTTGAYNTGLGYTALAAVTTGSGNVMVGGMTSGGGFSPPFNPTTQNDRVMIGSTSTTNAYVQVAWTVTSDARDKTDFGPVPLGLDFVTQLKPTAYRYKANREDTEGNGPLRYGFLAQDVLALEGDAPVIIDNEDPDKLKITDQNLIAVLVNAVQELQALVIDLNARVIG